MHTFRPEFITDYNLCDDCSRTLKSVASMYASDLLGDTDDPEAPLMYCSDHNMLCGGGACRALPDGSRPTHGDTVMTDWGKAIVIAWAIDKYEVEHLAPVRAPAKRMWEPPEALRMYHGDTSGRES